MTFIITLIDIVITFSIMFDIRKTIVNFKDNTLTNIFKKNQDNTEEINKKIRTILNEKSFLHHHLIKTYNNLKIYKNNITKTSIIIKKRYQDKIETKFVVSIFLSIFIGYLIGKLVNKIGLVISICFAINIIIIKLMDKKDE